MEGRYRNFDTAVAEATGEPVRFTFRGRDYVLPPEVPAALLLQTARVAAEYDSADDVPAEEVVVMLRALFGAANTDLLLEDGATVTELHAIMEWVVSCYSGGAEPGEAPAPANREQRRKAAKAGAGARRRSSSIGRP